MLTIKSSILENQSSKFWYWEFELILLKKSGV
jgi:hypothetical protein